MEVAVLVIVWLVIGWMPSRIVKHYFYNEYPDLPDHGWCREDEVVSLLIGLIGPIGALGDLIARLTFGGRWGWMW